MRPGANLLADPLYEGEIAECIRGAVFSLTRFRVVADPTIRHLVEIFLSEKLIKIKPGQSIQRFQHIVFRAYLYVVGGARWAPEFEGKPRLRVVPDVPDSTRFKPVDRDARSAWSRVAEG